MDEYLARPGRYLVEAVVVRHLEQRSTGRVDHDPLIVPADRRVRRGRELDDGPAREKPKGRGQHGRAVRVAGAQPDRTGVRQAQPARLVQPPPKLLPAAGLV